MKNNRFILIITGPTGSGKSTVAAQLAKQLNNCVNIDVDYIKHFIVSGFKYDESATGKKQWQLMGENIGLLANNYNQAGYNVIINGYINDLAWDRLLKHIQPSHKILLLPEPKETANRDALRNTDAIMGEAAVNKHHNYFSTNSFYEDFTRIDSTKLTLEETIKKIQDILN